MTHSYPTRRAADLTGTNLAQQPLGERMDFLVAARPQAAVLARIGVDKTLVSIEQEDPVMAIAARQIGADFIVEPCFVARSEEHTSELPSLMRISYAVFCLKNKKQTSNTHTT